MDYKQLYEEAQEEIKKLKTQLKATRNQNEIMDKSYKNYKIISDIFIEREINRIDSQIFD
jgi:hypothetical protein